MQDLTKNTESLHDVYSFLKHTKQIQPLFIILCLLLDLSLVVGNPDSIEPDLTKEDGKTNQQETEDDLFDRVRLDAQVLDGRRTRMSVSRSRSTFLRVPEERAKPSFIRDQLRGFRNQISIEGITQSFRFVGSLIQSGSDIEYRFSIDSKGMEHQTLSKIDNRVLFVGIVKVAFEYIVCQRGIVGFSCGEIVFHSTKRNGFARPEKRPFLFDVPFQLYGILWRSIVLF